MKIAVVGGTGDVGTALVRALKRASLPEHELVVLARRYSDDAEPYSEVRWVSVDISSASSASAARCEFFGLRSAPVFGSWCTYPLSAPMHRPSPERRWTSPGRPRVVRSRPTVDKAAVERKLDAIEGSGMTIARLRPGLILQPDAASEIGRHFLGVQFVHAGDVADAIVRVIRQGAGGAFNLASEPVIDRATLAETTGMSMPAAPVGIVRAGVYATWAPHLRPTDVGWIALARGVPLLKTDQARNELGWQPRVLAGVLLKDFIEALGRGRGAASPAMRSRNPFRKAAA